MYRDLILLSGGLDSTTALARAVWRRTAAAAVTVDYGQRHLREVDAAKTIARHYGVPHQTIDLRAWGQGLTGSALTDPAVEVPHGHYAAESMKATIVPNRNATLLSAAGGVAVTLGWNRVVTAVHAGDHAIYPDCRPAFITHLARATEVGTDGALTINAPFVFDTKAEIAHLARELGVPIELTWSCYEGGGMHCGRCGTCVERREALSSNDPTEYDEESS